MFTMKQCDYVRRSILEMTQADPQGVLIGSTVSRTENCWPNIDVIFGIASEYAIEAIIDGWT